MGDSQSLLSDALLDLSSILEEIRVSSLYLTKPQDYIFQSDFYNLVVCGNFDGSARDLLNNIQRIENRFGRDRFSSIPKGPRTLDIDIILFGTAIISEKDLVIPHESVKKRQFVLVPMLELESDCTDPVTGAFYKDILLNLPDQGVRKVGKLHGQ